MQKLKVYMFSSAANHFNNPHKSERSRPHEERNIPHVKHYANSNDFVSQWGVLRFMLSLRHSDGRDMCDL